MVQRNIRKVPEPINFNITNDYIPRYTIKIISKKSIDQF